MAKFVQLNGLTSMKITSIFAALTISLTVANLAHAEKFCKSIDKDGNASYTTAPETGCKKKFKTVGVSQYKGTVNPAVTAIMEQSNPTHGADNAPTKANPAAPTTGNNAPTPTKTTAPTKMTAS